MNRGKARKDTHWMALRYVFRYKGYLAASLLLCLLQVLGTLYIPVLTGQAIDTMVSPGQVDLPRLVPLLVQIACCVGTSAVAQWFAGLCNNRMAYGTVRDIRLAAFARIQRLPLSMLDKHPTGDMVSRVIADIDQFADGLLIGFTQLFVSVLSILGILVFMYSMNPVIATVVVVITPASLWLASFVAKRTYHMFSEQAKTRGEQTSLVDEVIANQKVVQAYSQEARLQERFDEINERLGKISLKAIFFSSIAFPGSRFVNSLVYACVGVVSALFTIGSGGSSVGQLASFLSYVSQYTRPFNEISGVVTEMQSAFACAKRVFELINAPVETPDAAIAKTLERVDGRVSLENVSFSYDPARKLIENFHLNVSRGQRVAIVGPTGCGKTTMINLLMRFYDMDRGEIRVSGQEVREITRQSLRASYGMVLQDTWIKTATVRENLRMGREDATDAEIIAAAKATHAHSFIRRLPDGYDTVISEEMGNLSQGEKQLLCVTRVMLDPPPMLILDEATSSIDTRTERYVQEAFAKMMEGRTSFIVAHRLSTTQNADVILVMNEGRVVEQGTHEGLLALRGFYAKLYESQFAV